jgi:3-hydroxyisobutyrate dehydrogenase
VHDRYGATWLDAPVTGGPLAAERGTLAILCGGETADVARVEFLLAHVASTVTHFGSVGAGQAAKLCNQILAGSAMLACVESIVHAERLGLDPKLFAVAVEAGFASSPLTRLLLPRIAARTFDPPVGTTAMMLKDLANVLESAGDVGADLPLTEAAAQVFAGAVEMHLASREPSALIECYPPGTRRSSSM